MVYDLGPQPPQTGSNQRIVHDLLYRVFAWVAAAIALSGVAAYLAMDMPIFTSTPMVITLLLVQLGIVFLFSSSLMHLSVGTIRLLFFVYAIITGLVISGIFALYAPITIARVFFITAGMFGAMSLYGFYTKTDLSQQRTLLIMGLWGIIIALTVNIFMKSPAFDTLISCISVLIFCGLTAYDIQFIKQVAAFSIEQDEAWDAIAIRCALQLYLDILNLFLSLLRLSERQR